jgi:hypothetical protein
VGVVVASGAAARRVVGWPSLSSCSSSSSMRLVRTPYTLTH